jgi:hypothetical protein
MKQLCFNVIEVFDMVTLLQCAICFGQNSMQREHCQYCGARRLFIAGHSFQPTECTVKAQDTNSGRELVRAYRSDIAFQMITAR